MCDEHRICHIRVLQSGHVPSNSLIHALEVGVTILRVNKSRIFTQVEVRLCLVHTCIAASKPSAGLGHSISLPLERLPVGTLHSRSYVGENLLSIWLDSDRSGNLARVHL